MCAEVITVCFKIAFILSRKKGEIRDFRFSLREDIDILLSCNVMWISQMVDTIVFELYKQQKTYYIQWCSARRMNFAVLVLT